MFDGNLAEERKLQDGEVNHSDLINLDHVVGNCGLTDSSALGQLHIAKGTVLSAFTLRFSTGWAPSVLLLASIIL